MDHHAPSTPARVAPDAAGHGGVLSFGVENTKFRLTYFWQDDMINSTIRE